jgi:hypothetical protein
MTMQLKQLGKTELQVSEIGFGAIPIIRLGQQEAGAVLRHALERGINFFDTANAYRDSEEKIGRALAGQRDKIVIASKTMRRDAEGVREHLERSLQMLGTDYLDLYQLHQIAQEKDWQAVSAPGGALEEVIRARDAGKIRYLGVTSHSLPMALKLVRTGLFSTIQFPFNFIEEVAAVELIPLAQKLGMGYIGMKPFGGGAIDNAAIAFKYLRQYPDCIPIPGFESLAQIDEVIDFYAVPNRVKVADLSLMENYRQELGKRFCRRCEYCMPCPNGVLITPAMGYKIVVNRMSPAVAVDFCKVPMETVANCNACFICVGRCPYDLQIPEIIKVHRDLYLEHCRVDEG